MTPERFEDILVNFQSRQRLMLVAKSLHYARGGERLANFKVGAQRSGQKPSTVLWGYREKHETALDMALKELEADALSTPGLERFTEWIEDSANYLVLLLAILTEHFEQKKADAVRAREIARDLTAKAVASIQPHPVTSSSGAMVAFTPSLPKKAATKRGKRK